MKALISWLLPAGALALGAFLSVAGLRGQAAPGPQPTDFTFGMVGLAPGQTAQLNVVNVGLSGNVQFPCRLFLAFVDNEGKPLKQTFVQVDRGKAASLDLSLEEAHDRHGHEALHDRIEIRGIGYNPLLSDSSGIPISLSCNLIPTLEVFDTDEGTTSAILTDSVRLNPLPPPLAAVEQ